MARRSVNQEIKRRGILPSFGDIVLPFVGIAGVALLGIAGWHFFIDGMKTSPGISSTKAYADSPVLIAERELEAEKIAEQPAPEQVTPAQSVQPKSEVLTAQNPIMPSPSAAVKPVKQVQTPAQTVQTQPQKNIQAQNLQPSTKKITSNPSAAVENVKSAPETVKETKPVIQVPDPKIKTNYPSNQQYRIQVGAYGSKEAANVEAKKLSKAGFRTTVYANPESKHVRVWILAGNSKQNAQNILEKVKPMGYKTSFIVAPSVPNKQ